MLVKCAVHTEDRDGHTYASFIDNYLLENQKEIDRIEDITKRVAAIYKYDQSMPAVHACYPEISNTAYFMEQVLPKMPNWNDALSKIEIEHEKIKAFRKANKYKEDRQKEYPSISEMIVALWEKVVENRQESSDELQSKRTAIKNKYPKL